LVGERERLCVGACVGVQVERFSAVLYTLRECARARERER